MKFTNSTVRDSQVINLFEDEAFQGNVQPLESPSIEALIDSLPESFPQATETIKRQIAPLMTGADEGVRDHYVTLIKKRRS